MKGMQRQLRGLVERIVVAVPEAQPGSAEAAGTVTDAVNNGFEFVAHQHKPGINRKVYRAQGYNLRMNPKSRHGFIRRSALMILIAALEPQGVESGTSVYGSVDLGGRRDIK